MKTYGAIKFSTVDAPKPISGICENYNYKSAEQVFEVTDESGDLVGVVIHGRKGELSFSSMPGGAVTALGVRAGAELVITGINTGKVLVTQASASWQRGQPMTMSAQASHYPDIADAGVGTITPQAIALANGGAALVIPTAKVWYGVGGIDAPVAGLVQSCQISESVQALEEEDADGKIVAVVLHGYKATASLEILTAAAPPASGSEMELFGATFRVTSADERWVKGQTRSVALEGMIVPE